RRSRRAHVRLLRHRLLRDLPAGGSGMSELPLLSVEGLGKFYGARRGCEDVGFELWPGEVLAIVGESGSGKSTLLNCVSARLEPSAGTVSYRMRDGMMRD